MLIFARHSVQVVSSDLDVLPLKKPNRILRNTILLVDCFLSDAHWPGQKLCTSEAVPGCLLWLLLQTPFYYIKTLQ